MIAVADLRRYDGDIRITRAAEPRSDRVWPTPTNAPSRLGEIGFPVDANPLRATRSDAPGSRIAISPSPRRRAGSAALIEHLEARFGDDASEPAPHLDGCPHACGQHWVGDLGFQGTTVRDAEGRRHQAYDVLLRGALGPERRHRAARLPPRSRRKSWTRWSSA